MIQEICIFWERGCTAAPDTFFLTVYPLFYEPAKGDFDFVQRNPYLTSILRFSRLNFFTFEGTTVVHL